MKRLPANARRAPPARFLVESMRSRDELRTCTAPSSWIYNGSFKRWLLIYICINKLLCMIPFFARKMKLSVQRAWPLAVQEVCFHDFEGYDGILFVAMTVYCS
jgi:hypothetical protein